MSSKPPPGPAVQPPAGSQLITAPYGMNASPGFDAWLAEIDAVVAITTYESGRLLLIGRDEQGKLVHMARTFERAMGICMNRQELHLSTIFQVWHFRNFLENGQQLRGYDLVYVPRTCHVTGYIDIHDMAFEEDGRIVFANTLYSCVCTFQDGYSFKPIWKPDWITALMPEDRCHLNGLGVRDGKARYVTVVGKTDVKEGWRLNRNGAGVLWDIVENRPIATGLTMPHSPRWHEEKLYFINAGTGYLCQAHLNGDAPTEICFCPGFARGLHIHGKYALVGTSSQRQNRTFSDLPLDENLKRHGVPESRCAMLVIDLTTGKIVHSLTFSGSINELYDIAIVPGSRRANALGFQKDDVFYAIDIAP